MTKKLIAIAAVIVIAAAAVVGGTLAWFTDADTATNVLTTGNIDITLTETAVDGQTATVNPKGLDIPDIMPGDTVHKDPKITNNSGTESAWIRAKFTVANTSTPGTAASGALIDPIVTAIDLDIDDAVWLKGNDGWYYLKAALPATGTNSVYFFEEIEFVGATFGNAYQNASFNVVINVQATQVDNQALPAAPVLTDYQGLGWPA